MMMVKTTDGVDLDGDDVDDGVEPDQVMEIRRCRDNDGGDRVMEIGV